MASPIPLQRIQAPLRRTLAQSSVFSSRTYATIPPSPSDPAAQPTSASSEATTTTGPAKSPRPTYFKNTTLAPFSDFLPTSASAASEAYVPRTATVGPEGRKRTITRLPDWLKTPIP
ncbi:hypothetical protein VTH82DRAFT_7933, partial [Thermothelomyces myriococcoides]